MSTALIWGSLIFVDLCTGFILIWNLNNGQGFNINTFLGALFINIVGIFALRTLKK
ncbi:MAG: hypothetical protein H7095_06120 [Pseudopedobacter sp.]|nr:hypothetical protein [Deinococcales bacterium]